MKYCFISIGEYCWPVVTICYLLYRLSQRTAGERRRDPCMKKNRSLSSRVLKVSVLLTLLALPWASISIPCIQSEESVPETLWLANGTVPAWTTHPKKASLFINRTSVRVGGWEIRWQVNYAVLGSLPGVMHMGNHVSFQFPGSITQCFL